MVDNISIDDILASLDKETRSGLRLGNEIEKEFLPTASFAINKDIGGGLALGKQHTVWGGEGSGKSGFMMQTVGLNQKMGVPCAWIDAEGIFDPEWAAKLGVDVDKLIISRIQTISEATNLQIKLINQGVKLIVIDTTSELWPKSFIDKTGEVKNFDETGQLGQQSKDLGQMSKMVMGMNYTCAIVHISQQRVDLGSPALHKPFIPTGGREIKHNDAIRLRLIGTKQDSKMIKEKVQRGNNLVEKVVGFPVTWSLEKNRLTGMETFGGYDFMKEDIPGLSQEGEILDLATEFGFVEKGGSWYTIYGERAQGRTAAIKMLKEKPELVSRMESEIESVQ